MKGYLAHFDAARRELSLARSLDEVKSIRDKAEMLRAYAKQVGESLEMQNYCAEIKLRAERRAGKMLKEQELHEGGRPSKNQSHDASGFNRPKLEDIGIKKDQSSRWQRIAELPEEKFEQHIVEYKESAKELTSASVIRLATQVKEDEMKASLCEVPLPEGKYKSFVIDPPWPIKKIAREVRPNQAQFDYPTMTIDDIKKIPLAEKIDDSAHIFLWTTQKFLPSSFEVLSGWGARYIFTMVWQKSGGYQPFNLPQYNCEFVLYGRIGHIEFLDTKNFFTCFAAPRREHSRKPDEFYELVSRICQERRLDMFSREPREGFEQYGNEPEKFREGLGS